VDCSRLVWPEQFFHLLDGEKENILFNARSLIKMMYLDLQNFLHFRQVVSNSSAHFEAIKIRQHQVENDQVWVVFLQGREGLRARLGRAGVEPFPLQISFLPGGRYPARRPRSE
jgi:hypothetical protein